MLPGSILYLAEALKGMERHPCPSSLYMITEVHPLCIRCWNWVRTAHGFILPLPDATEGTEWNMGYLICLYMMLSNGRSGTSVPLICY